MVIVMTMIIKMQNTRNDEDDVMMVITMMTKTMTMMVMMMMTMVNSSFSLTFPVCRKRDARPLEHLKTDDCHHENEQESIKWSLYLSYSALARVLSVPTP